MNPHDLTLARSRLEPGPWITAPRGLLDDDEVPLGLECALPFLLSAGAAPFAAVPSWPGSVAA